MAQDTVTDLTGIGARGYAELRGARLLKTVKACAAKTVGSLRVANIHCLGGVCPSWIATDWVKSRSPFGRYISTCTSYPCDGILLSKSGDVGEKGREYYGISHDLSCQEEQ